ncbi:MAG: hypothetical protein GC155_04450 [Alphaproteobacteria bacterium]|nr:hypothetical protein [Alphaproteobacteria bacterium]
MADLKSASAMDAGKSPSTSETAKNPFVAREAVYTGERVVLTEQQQAARKRRSLWLVLALLSFVILVFVITITRLGANALATGL